MAVVRLLVQLDRDTMLPEDRIVNNWYVTTQANTSPDRDTQAAVATLSLEDFYQGIDSVLLNSSLAGTGTISAYDLDDAEPRVPFLVTPIVVVPAATAPAPGEVNMVLSYQAEAQSGVNQARRRGRVFIGPLPNAAYEAATGGVRPTSAAQNTLADQARLFLDASDAAATWAWQVYSPTTRGAGVASSGISLVTNGWVDNALDTMRSRGLAGNARVVWEATP